ncbi:MULTISPECIES: Vps62-related protein [unclassified Pseudomonas]|uniref:Vps62-related protein n=1 Tax=unclassified Pseudomonas TaxID=196821 RepID=UPI000A1EC8A5|nr:MULTISPECIES: Vps62-related protein [unclassified Pseudomonas]
MKTQEKTSQPIERMEPIKLDNLLISFTTEFHRIWETRGSRSSPAGFWRPTPAPDALPGYFPLGDIAIHSSADINGEIVAAVVCESDSEGIESSRGKALMRPDDFELVWKHSGSSISTRTSIWRPIAPVGYVALGLVCSNDHSKPSSNVVRCIREDLVIAARVGDSIWNDKGSGATQNFSAWSIEPPTAEPGEIYFAAGTFIGVQSHTKPSTHIAAYALRMQIPVRTDSAPAAPVLNQHSVPSDAGTAMTTQTVRLPWFAVRDYTTAGEQFLKSPFYLMKRTDQYLLIGFDHNDTDKRKTLKWSAPRAQNATAMQIFNRLTSIEIEKAWPVTALSDVRATRFSARLHKQFTHTEELASGWEESRPPIVFTIAAKKTSVAVFQLHSYYELTRADGTPVATIFGYSDDSSIYLTEYPTQADEQSILCPSAVSGSTKAEVFLKKNDEVTLPPQPMEVIQTATDTAP